MHRTPKQIHLAAHFPGVNNTTVWSDPRSGSHIEFSSFAHLAQTAERAKFDFLFLAEGLRLREQGGEIYDLDVVGLPDTFTVLAALAAVTDRLGLAGTINSTFNEPYEVARQFASLDHLSGGRAAWNVVTSWDAFTGENFRRGGFLPQDQRYERARTFLQTAGQLFESWDGSEIIADQESGQFLADPQAGAFRHHDAQFSISGQFNVPRSPQGRPVIFQAGDSDEGREFAASSADAIFSRHSQLADGQAFYTDVKRRLPRYGRRPGELLILPAATFVLAGTDAEAQELAREVRRQQVSGQTAIKFAEQLWNRDLSGLDPDGPLPGVRPRARREHHRPRPGQRPDVPGPGGHRPAVAGEGRGGEAVAARADHRGDRPPVVRRLGGHRGRGHQRARPGRRLRRVHPGAAHHAGGPGRVRRHGSAAAPGARRVPHRVRRPHAARAPGPSPAPGPFPGHPGGVMTTPLAVLDLVPISFGSTAAQALRNSIDLARQAERLGYTRYWFAEHHLNPGVAGASPAVVLALTAAATSRIRIGSGAVQLGHRTALSTVEEFGLIDALHPGRLDLGLGRSGGRPPGRSRQPALAGPAQAGRAANGLLIPPPFPIERLLRSPRIGMQKSLLMLPGAEPQNYTEQVGDILALLRGTYRSADGVEGHAVPGEHAAVQVWILGSSGGESAQVAGASGLRFAANYHVSPATVLEAAEGYRAAFRPSAELDRPYVSVSADVVVAEDEATARRLASGYGLWVRSIRTGPARSRSPPRSRPPRTGGPRKTGPWSPTGWTPSSPARRGRSPTSSSGCATRPAPTS